jgi:hypothetical protein
MALALFLSIAAMHAQGLVLFNNRVSASANNPTIDAPIFPGSPIDGNIQPNIRAALYGAVGNAPESSLVLLTNPISGQGAVSLRSGAAAGYVNVGSEGARSISGAGYNVAVTVQVRVWGGGYASYEDAMTQGAPSGKSNVLLLQTSSDDVTPTPLVGLQFVPEPSTYMLGIGGIAALLLSRSRSRRT